MGEKFFILSPPTADNPHQYCRAGLIVNFFQHRREPDVPKPYLHAQRSIMREAIGGTGVDREPKLG